MIHNRLFVLVFLVLGISGCGDEIVVSRQVLEIVSTSEAVVTAPPAEVFEVALGKVRADKMETWKGLYPKEASDFIGGLTPAQFETFEAFKRLLERKMDGVPLAEFDLLPLQKSFYTKYIDAEGIAIVANAEVADKHLIEARRVVLTMTVKHPALREGLSMQAGFYLVLVGKVSSFRDIPEMMVYDYMLPGCLMQTSVEPPNQEGYCFSQVLQGRDQAYLQTFVHEFAHALEREMQRLDPSFRDRLTQAYEQAMALEIWTGYYAEHNQWEYWAEGVELWFYEVGPGRQHETYAEFAARDPALASLMTEEEWAYNISADIGWETYEAFFERDPLLAKLLDEWFPRIALPRRY